MRRGARRSEWSTADVRYLTENAGLIPRREICLHLRRSTESVKQKAKHLRMQGIPVDLRCFRSKLEPCPKCGNLSATLDRTGFCKPCRQRDQLATIHYRISELLQRLPVSERDTYMNTEAETESARHIKPKPPRTQGMSAYARARAKEQYATDIEAWESANLLRQIKAAQKRKERIEKKVKSMTP